MTYETSRREFLRTSTAAGLGTVLGGVQLTSSAIEPKSSRTKKIDLHPIDKVRIGIIGMGGRGNSLMGNFFHMKGDVEIRALCDIYPERVKAARERVIKAGFSKPETYSGNEYIWRKLVDRDDIDAIIITTYWKWHTPMAVYAMKAGKYVGVEVPAAYTLEECWQLVETSEQTGLPCMMLENWSFRSDNLAVLNMIRLGLLGEIMHCHCAHSHDCIGHFFFDSQTGKDRWPAKYLAKHNRDQYPSHQLGPVISWMDINCGDYFDYITATATDAVGINEYFASKFGPEHPNAKRKFAQGDIVTTVVRTKKGKSIVINYDMQLPRPYDNRWLVQGTRGLYNEQRNAVYIKDKSPKYHQWESFQPYQEKYRHTWT
ncbi:MAG: Gfo/Idh/MocA family oxidoreductase, partial [Planctomycetota bacterium]